jgi:mono/diheme cytochrome c family protein
MTRKTDASYPAADFMDDPEMAKQGLTLIRHYGCSGCHEIRGLETEGRIGTELTVEGSKPIERLDFALLTHEAEQQGWYNHKGFFEHKLENPAVFDQGKVRVHLEKLRMPNFHLSEDEITALTTFLLGSVDTELPKHYRYEPEDDRKAVQEGWWIARRYNCVGCHQISLGGRTALMGIPRYQDPDFAASALFPGRAGAAGLAGEIPVESGDERNRRASQRNPAILARAHADLPLHRAAGYEADALLHGQVVPAGLFHSGGVGAAHAE